MDAVDVIPYYKLGLGNDCKQCVALLTKDFSFHMPGEWGGEGGNVSFALRLNKRLTHCTGLAGMEAKWKGGVPLPCSH